MKSYLILLFFIIFTSAFCQDLIIKKNGDIISSKVIEVLLAEIKYKKADNPQGPIYSILKSDVFLIKYQNGSKDVFEEVKAEPEKIEKEPKEAKEPAIEIMDEIIMKAGSDIKCRIVEVTTTEINYITSNAADAPIKVCLKSDALMIKFSTGAKMAFNVETKPIEPIKPPIDTFVPKISVQKKDSIPKVEMIPKPVIYSEADIIELKNFNEIEAVVDSISETEFIYRRYDNQTGPKLKIKKDEVVSVKYSPTSKLKRKPITFQEPTKQVETSIPKIFDIIVTLNGDEIRAEILSIDTNVINYKREGNETILRIKKSDVFKIKHPNGKFEVITAP